MQGGDSYPDRLDEVVHMMTVLDPGSGLPAFLPGHRQPDQPPAGEPQYLFTRESPDGTYLYVNTGFASFFWKRREEIIGTRFEIPMPAEDLRHIRDITMAFTRAQPSVNFDHRIFLPDGSLRWLRSDRKALYSDNRGLIGYSSLSFAIPDPEPRT